jgi:HlyD family secretion protein
MKRPVLLIGIACAGLAILVWTGIRALQGPTRVGYPVTARPLVQTVVATGRVAALSRAQVGSPVTDVVIERRVREGDVVSPGDVLAVLRADDLVAGVHEAIASSRWWTAASRRMCLGGLSEPAWPT